MPASAHSVGMGEPKERTGRKSSHRDPPRTTGGNWLVPPSCVGLGATTSAVPSTTTRGCLPSCRTALTSAAHTCLSTSSARGVRGHRRQAPDTRPPRRPGVAGSRSTTAAPSHPTRDQPLLRPVGRRVPRGSRLHPAPTGGRRDGGPVDSQPATIGAAATPLPPGQGGGGRVASAVSPRSSPRPPTKAGATNSTFATCHPHTAPSSPSCQ